MCCQGNARGTVHTVMKTLLTCIVYKKHKEEFYDPFKRVWRCETDYEELDAEDDDIISRAVAVNAGYFNMPA